MSFLLWKLLLPKTSIQSKMWGPLTLGNLFLLTIVQSKLIISSPLHPVHLSISEIKSTLPCCWDACGLERVPLEWMIIVPASARDRQTWLARAMRIERDWCKVRRWSHSPFCFCHKGFPFWILSTISSQNPRYTKNFIQDWRGVINPTNWYTNLWTT